MSHPVEIIVFYVGFGDCIHITLPDNKQLLIDTGHKKHAERVISKLKGMDKRIDYLLITHAHSDHINGAMSFIEEFHIDTVVWWMDSNAHPSMSNVTTGKIMIQEIVENDLTLYTIYDAIKHIASFKKYIELNYPVKENISPPHSNPNNNSIVFSIKLGSKRLVFSGDTTKQEEREMVGLGRLKNIKFLKIAHHCSDTSTSVELQQQFTCSPVLVGSTIDRPKNKAKARRKPPSKEKIDELSVYGKVVLTEEPLGKNKKDIFFRFWLDAKGDLRHDSKIEIV